MSSTPRNAIPNKSLFLSQISISTEQRANSVLRVAIESGEQLLGIQTCHGDQSLGSIHKSRRRLSLQRLRFEGLGDVGKATTSVLHDCWILSK